MKPVSLSTAEFQSCQTSKLLGNHVLKIVGRLSGSKFKKLYDDGSEKCIYQ